jgi:hypothetical protein
MNVEKIAALIFRFAGIFLLLGLLPMVIPESIAMLYYSARFGSHAATGSNYGWLNHLWPIIGIGMAIVMLVCSRALSRMITKGL